MRLGHPKDDLLQRFHDGEISDASSRSVQQHLDECRDCRQRHQSLVKLHNLIAMNAEQIARDVDFDRLFNRVKADIARQRQAGLWEKVQIWWENELQLWRPQVWAPAAAVAVTAAVLIAVNVTGSGPVSDNMVSGTKVRRSMPAAIPGPAQEAPASEVVEVDFGDKPGTVIEVALADGVSTPVVWINDDVEDSVIQ